MTYTDIIPTRLTPGAAALVACAGQIITDPTLPTLGVTVDDRGQVILILGHAFLTAPTECAKSWMLEHEACHIALGHPRRGQVLKESEEKAGKKFSLDKMQRAADAAIHHRCLDPVRLQSETGVEPVTFEHLGIQPCPMEVAYFKIPDPPQGPGHGPGPCGHKWFKDLPEWAKAEIADAVQRHSASLAGTVARPRPPLSPTAVKRPLWESLLLKWLESCRGRSIRGRSWNRTHRSMPELPGRSRTKDRHALILVDCSGSISEADLQQVVGLLGNMKWRCEVILWAVEHTERLTPKQACAILTAGTGPGGGTSPAGAARLRHGGERVIWLTDGYVDSWPRMTKDDVVLTTGAEAPSPAVNIKLR